MKNKGIKLGINILLFCLSTFSFAETEVGLYSLEINKKIKTNATKVYIKDEKFYVELQELLRVLELNNNTWINEKFTIDVNNIYGLEKEINLDKKYIFKGDKRIPYGDGIYEMDNKIYVRLDLLEELLGIVDIERNDDRLIMKMRTTFTLPVELSNIREFKREEFEKGDNATKKRIDYQRKLLAPGNLRLVYNYGKTFQPDSYDYKYLDAEYLGPLLYGDLELYYGIYPDLENYQTRLRYSEVYKNHDIVFGDMTVDMPNTLTGTVNEIKGISFVKDYGIRTDFEEDKITIEGKAPMGKFVELYKNGQLLSYVDVQNGRYVFENVSSVFGSDSFQLLIYNLDGSIKKETLSRYSNRKLERKGEFGYNFQVGQSEDDKYDQFIGEVNYGVTNNLTLMTGYYDLQYRPYYYFSDFETFKGYKLGTFSVGNFGENTYTLETEILRDTDGKMDYYLDYSQNYKDMLFTAEVGDYSDKTAVRFNKKNELYLTASKSKTFLRNLSMGLKYYEADYLYTGREREVGASFRTSIRSMVPEYTVTKNIDRDIIYHDFTVRSYYFPDYIIYGGVYHRNIRDYNETRYRVEVSSRRHTENGLRYTAYYEKSERYGDIYGITFNFDYDTWFSGGFYASKTSDGRSSVASNVTIDKVINLSDVNSRITSVENGNIQGIVFLDNNYNGIYDPGIDKVLPRTQVIVGGLVGITGEDGKYVINNLYPERYDLTVEPQNPLYKSQFDKYKVKVGQAAPVYLDIPIYPRKLVSGMISFEDETLQHKYLNTMFLNVIDIKTNQKLEVVVPEIDGYFILENLTLGKYKVVLESVNKPGVALYEKEIIITPETKEVNMDLNILGKDIENLKYEVDIY